MEKRSTVRKALRPQVSNITFDQINGLERPAGEDIRTPLQPKRGKIIKSTSVKALPRMTSASVDLTDSTVQRFTGEELNIVRFQAEDRVRASEEMMRIRQRAHVSDEERAKLVETALAIDAPKAARAAMKDALERRNVRESSTSFVTFGLQEKSVCRTDDEEFIKMVEEVERTRSRMIARATSNPLQYAISDVSHSGENDVHRLASPRNNNNNNNNNNQEDVAGLLNDLIGESTDDHTAEEKGLTASREDRLERLASGLRQQQQQEKSYLNRYITAPTIATATTAVASSSSSQKESQRERFVSTSASASTISHRLDVRGDDRSVVSFPSISEVAMRADTKDSPRSSSSNLRYNDGFKSDSLLSEQTISVGVSGYHRSNDSRAEAMDVSMDSLQTNGGRSDDRATEEGEREGGEEGAVSNNSFARKNRNFHIKVLLTSSLCDWLTLDYGVADDPVLDPVSDSGDAGMAPVDSASIQWRREREPSHDGDQSEFSPQPKTSEFGPDMLFYRHKEVSRSSVSLQALLAAEGSSPSRHSKLTYIPANDCCSPGAKAELPTASSLEGGLWNICDVAPTPYRLSEDGEGCHYDYGSGVGAGSGSGLGLTSLGFALRNVESSLSQVQAASSETAWEEYRWLFRQALRDAAVAGDEAGRFIVGLLTSKSRPTVAV